MVTELERLRVALADRYRVQRELGRGGMATVYLAEDLKHHRQVAIKVLGAEVAAALGPERFLREIEIAAGLTHPHILPLHDSGEADGLLYYVMPFVEGESLRDRLARQKQLSVHETIDITRAVADALSYAHSLGIVHRDIKPENILFEAGHPVVTDFGIARAITEAGGEHLTGTGIAVGTPAYMSPEQAAGARELDARSDIYALGCVLYELLAGQPPFTEPSAQAMLARHSLDPVPRLRTVRETVPEALEAVVLRALAKVPADRFATAREFAEALEESARGAEVAGPLRSVRRPGAVRLAAAATIVVVGVGAWWALARPGADGRRIESLAVLPLKNLMGDPEQDYFVEGMHEALTAELSKSGALKIISRTSTMRYKDTEKVMPQIARELGVDGLIEGSVLREGDRVRITVQLIHGPSDRHLWAESYERELRGILGLQSEVARAISREIKAGLAPQAEARLAARAPPNPDAYEAYLRGRFHFNQWTERGMQMALQFFREAVEKDPTYAPAYVGLADAYAILGSWDKVVMPPHEAMPRSKAAAMRALELDEGLAGAHVALGYALFHYDWDWPAAEREFRRALELNPNLTAAHHWYSHYLIAMRRTDEALAAVRRALELDPLDVELRVHLAWHYHHVRDWPKSLQAARDALELNPNFAEAHARVGDALRALGRYHDAIEAYQRSATLSGGDISPLVGLAFVSGLSGRRDEARRILAQVERLSTERFVSPAERALIHVGLGEKDRAMAFLQDAYHQRSGLLVYLQLDERFDSLRSDQRFEDLLRRMNFPD